MNIKSYSEAMGFETLEDRFEYLKIGGAIGARTFGGNRYLNQALYSSRDWRKFRDKIIIRDCGRDLAFPGLEISWKAVVHHINPLTEDDIKRGSAAIFDPENVITVSFKTHEAIHYANESLLFPGLIIERKPYDTCPWKEGAWRARTT